MFNNYMFKDGILYLEINMNYEFGNFNSNHKNIIDEIKEYITKRKLNIKKKKIVLTFSGVIIGSILLTGSDKSIQNNNITYVPSFKNNIPYVYKLEDNINEEQQKNIDIKENINIDENTTKNSTEKSNTTKNSTEKSNISTNINNEAIEDIQNNISTANTTSPSDSVIIKRSNGPIINIDLEEYIIGVIAAEMPASFNIEALKAQSVLARTYALKSKSIGKALTDTVSTQAYIDINQMKTKWGSSFDTYYNKIKNAVNSTNGEYLTYNGTYIEAMYHSTSNGTTESSIDVFGNYYPYLINVNSSYDINVSSYLRTTTYSLDTINSLLGTSLTNESNIEILSRTGGNNINEISLDNTIFTGKQLRELLSLRSTDFDISINNNIVTFTTRGYGHGVGMSQYGANEMAKVGYGYKDILSHYYPGTTLSK